MTAVRDFEYRDPISPVPWEAARPKWSVMIPAYNCARFLATTLESVLAQDPGPAQMQIEVVDDCSSDDPQRVLKEIGGNRVGFFHQPQNLGHIGNFHTCLDRARGELVHLLHGDDAVRPGF
ncbi:glycosyltransferase family 2 protein [Mesorhizobium sp. M4B.F.Ca.ET.088.02.2.1]|nr:glycosyltransferase family 2 protein [Mesorhizobium sp. M4B.F.Ca.ET.088.02.2.1]